MKRWLFAGICDKSDFILYVSKILASAGHKVLVVDATARQKYIYSIGSVDSYMSITQFSGFDVAISFQSNTHLEQYLSEEEAGIEQYDYVLYDIDIVSFCSEVCWQEAEGRIWLTTFERYCVEKSAAWFEQLLSEYSGLQSLSPALKFNQVYLNTVDWHFEETYIHSFVEHLPFEWDTDAEQVVIPWDEMNYAIKLENEYNRTLRMKQLSHSYLRGLSALICHLSNIQVTDIKRAIKVSKRAGRGSS
ncbi:hypothetical protein PASE110613_00655 [Paenibacillus sediminis]|uniref:Uncharacterized protein n=1 Tax=Paenibacillus sediminis TaxID=664909 RepID=A0ABS4H061_9BACL|nr:hypothetical protein [Paenibacillus sediminis]MBP1935909.1 hypothetical protein [Paenibacillus sediminis]